MHQGRLGISVSLVALVATAALVASAPASAAGVSGRQLVVNADKGKYRMAGGLRGQWRVTAFRTLDQKPVFRAKGKERFKGCLNRDRDRSCKGEPRGVLKFKFHFWAKFGSDGSEQLGTCAHRVVGGRGDFAGATGFLMFVDTPIGRPPFTKSHYQGRIDLSHAKGSPKLASETRYPKLC